MSPKLVRVNWIISVSVLVLVVLKSDILVIKILANLFISASLHITRVFLKDIIAMHLSHQINSWYQPCYEGFITKITGSPNMVCTVNHAMEELQHKILYLFKYYSLHCHMKMERAREREGRLRQHREWNKKRNRRATAIQVGKTEYCTCDGLL